MRYLGVSALVLTVAGCVPPTPVAVTPSDQARIAAVDIAVQTVSITMTDGARCVVTRPEGITTGWSGVTDNCGYALPYEVIFRLGGQNADRFLVEESFGVVGADGTVRPRAEVYVIDVDGVRRQFLAPLPETATIKPVTDA